MTQKIFAIFLAFIYTQCTWAQLFDMSKQPNNNGNEFFVGREYGKPLVKVNLVSGVQRPGVYHVPEGSDLAEVIAYAGGASEKANLNDVSIVRVNGKQKTHFDVDFERRLTHPDEMPIVANQDIVHIPINRSLDRTMTWVGILSGMASIALAVAVIDNQHK